jgi:class 3 adenylate cyclase
MTTHSFGGARAVRDLIICFLDLSDFARAASHREETEIAEMIDAYYERIADAAARAGGTVVKFIGDGALLAFPVDRADEALTALLDLRSQVDDWLRSDGWSSHLLVKAHSGPVVAGDYGPRDAKRFDVIGNVVNVAARLPRPFHISPQFFRLLAPETRQRLKKHTPPITYIPVEDRHA